VILDGILMLAVYGLIWGLFRCYGQALFQPLTVVYSNHTMKLMSGRVGLTGYTIISRVRVTCHNPINNRVGFVSDPFT
jgi:hypothetical protein